MSEDKALVQLQFQDYRIRRIMDEDTGGMVVRCC